MASGHTHTRVQFATRVGLLYNSFAKRGASMN